MYIQTVFLVLVTVFSALTGVALAQAPGEPPFSAKSCRRRKAFVVTGWSKDSIGRPGRDDIAVGYQERKRIMAGKNAGSG